MNINPFHHLHRSQETCLTFNVNYLTISEVKTEIFCIAVQFSVCYLCTVCCQKQAYIKNWPEIKANPCLFPARSVPACVVYDRRYSFKKSCSPWPVLVVVFNNVVRYELVLRCKKGGGGQNSSWPSPPYSCAALQQGGPRSFAWPSPPLEAMPAGMAARAGSLLYLRSVATLIVMISYTTLLYFQAARSQAAVDGLYPLRLS